jgi:putative ATP-binding cassette transporter
MKLIEFLKKESETPPYKLIFMAVIAGLSNAMVLAVINNAAEQIAKRAQNTQLLVMFAVSMALYIISQKYILVNSATQVENIINKFRIRFATLLAGCDLQQFESIGRSEIYSTVATETLSISQSVTTLIVGAQSAILIFFTSIYVAWLSLPAFLICFAFVTIAILRASRKSCKNCIWRLRKKTNCSLP